MIKKLLIAFTICLLGFVAFLPTLASTSWGSKILLSAVNHRISGSVAYDNASFSWFGPSVIQKLSLNHASGSTIVAIQSLTLDSPLWQLWFSSRVPPVTVQQMSVHLEQYPNGVTNIDQAVRPTERVVDASLGVPIAIDLTGVEAEISENLLKVQGETRQGEQRGNFNVEWDLSKAFSFATININALPTALLDQLIPDDALAFRKIVSTGLGPHFDLHITAVENSFKVEAKSERLYGQLQGKKQGDMIVMETPTHLDFIITPALLSYFTDQTLLKKPAPLSIIVNKLEIPLPGSKGFPVASLQLDERKSDALFNEYLGNAVLDLSLSKNGEPHLTLNNRIFTVDSILNVAGKTANGTITLKPDTTVAFVAKIQKGSILFNLDGKELKGSLQLENDYDVNADLQFRGFPVADACEIVCPNQGLREAVRSTLGKLLDGTIQIAMKQWDGYFKGDLRGENGKAKVNSRLTHGVLTLAEPMQADLKVTPALGKSILRDVFPLLDGILSSSEPVSLTIPVEGTQVQILPFTPQNANVGKSVLSLGTITFDSSGEIGKILSLLNSKNAKKIEVRFTPLYFNVETGKVNLSRLDMLILNEYPLAAWGKVNIPKDKVSMVVGFTPRAIEKAFGIGGIPDQYMLQIEIKGTTDNATINQSKAIAKISALVAASQGTQGAILGTVIGLASGSLNEPAPPAPTTNPLPWSITASKKQQKAAKTTVRDDLIEALKSSTDFMR